ncbi:hypothetical protein NQ314_016343 [Rhamnusium bicolor]|uniref:Uncharacterized protein n=1 Tax=Rhamnusium bicolor TaxID=1586634 RepID=A0AAV8WWF7_9CUCU|nr:hypothetical protein NQ314_016343 [Rhamnusium bicolor]
MGSLALKDLTEKCTTKYKKISVTKDIILLKNYCHEIANKSLQILEVNLNNVESFKNISEATLALTILINRKRVGDVQYLKLNNYTLPQAVNEEHIILTESERALSKNFKRVVTIGKGSKAVPILIFSGCDKLKIF